MYKNKTRGPKNKQKKQYNNKMNDLETKYEINMDSDEKECKNWECVSEDLGNVFQNNKYWVLRDKKSQIELIDDQIAHLESLFSDFEKSFLKMSDKNKKNVSQKNEAPKTSTQQKSETPKTPGHQRTPVQPKTPGQNNNTPGQPKTPGQNNTPGQQKTPGATKGNKLWQCKPKVGTCIITHYTPLSDDKIRQHTIVHPQRVHNLLAHDI